MATFINTMFVRSPSPLRPHSYPPQPLPALHSNVLAASESAIHLLPPSSPGNDDWESSLHRQIHSVFHEDGKIPYIPPATTSNSDNNKSHSQHRADSHHESIFPKGLLCSLSAAALWEAGGRKGNLLTRGNSNARARNTAAFQPTKRPRGTNSLQLKQFAEATLGSGSLRKVVQLPEGENRDEWLAVNLVDFYNQINLLYGAITEFCSPASCPEMKATDEFEYLWHDPPTYPKPTRLPAPTYIGHLLTWTSQQLSNPIVFPTQPGVPFPEGFEKTVRVLFKRLYRVYAHIYCHHYSVVRGLGLEAHLNTGFKHYVLFVEEFGLAEEKGGKKGEWFGPLGELVESMLRSD